MLTWVVVQHGKVIDAEARCRGFVGRTLDEVTRLVLSHGDQIYRVSRFWHTCVDEGPWSECPACREGELGLYARAVYYIKAKQK